MQDGAVDTVITNALILDHWGIVKADVGLKDGRIARDRQGRQSRTSSRASHRRSARAREVIAGEGKILTAGGFDCTSTSSARSRSSEALMSGVTTMLGGGTGPAAGHQRHHLHARTLAHRADAPGLRRVPGQPRLRRARATPPCRGRSWR